MGTKNKTVIQLLRTRYLAMVCIDFLIQNTLPDPNNKNFEKIIKNKMFLLMNIYNEYQ